MMKEENVLLSDTSLAMLQVASQLWYFGIVYTTLGTLFRDDIRLSLEMVISLSTTLYLYSILWTFRWYGEKEVMLCSFTALGLFAAFLSIIRLVSSPQYRQYSLSLIVFLIASTLLSIAMFLHAPALFFDTVSEASCCLLVLAPSIGYQLSASLAPLQYYISATGFSAFWLISAVLALGRHQAWWPLLLATLTLSLSVQQLLFFFRNNLTTTASPLSLLNISSGGSNSSSSSSDSSRRLSGSFVLRELRFNQPQYSASVRRDSTNSYQTISDAEADTTDDEAEQQQQRQQRQQPPSPATLAQSPFSDVDEALLLPRLSLLLSNAQPKAGEWVEPGGSRRSSLSHHRRESSLDSFYSYGSCFDDNNDELEQQDLDGASLLGERAAKRQKDRRKRRHKSSHLADIESV